MFPAEPAAVPDALGIFFQGADGEMPVAKPEDGAAFLLGKVPVGLAGGGAFGEIAIVT